MLFSSFEFILVFWPLAAVGYALLRRTAPAQVATAWLVFASLIFYGWWSARDLGLITISMGLNYGLARFLGPDQTKSRRRLSVGIALNLAALGYFKYAGFLADNVGALLARDLQIDVGPLPLAISFFTFQQIAYLVDVHRGGAKGYGPLEYALFVTFFPQLIAGPIVHHGEVIPQFRALADGTAPPTRLSAGVTVFAIGLFKKAVIADGLAHWSAEGFGASLHGHDPGLYLAWKGALAYTFQLYFDFSGYADMACGVGKTMGIELPQNFDSPYKATSMIDFWRRWHITLSRFLRDYLYIPLGGNRNGPRQRERNLLLTMLLGGLWHGAGWQFVIWGGLHGLYLAINHRFEQWRAQVRERRLPASDRGAPGGHKAPYEGTALSRMAGAALTFFLVVIAWVFFRAPDLGSAARMLLGMAALRGPSRIPAAPVWDGWTTLVFALCFVIVWALPNAPQIESWAFPEDRERAPRYPVLIGTIVGLMIAAAFMTLNDVSEFLYFQF